MALRVSIQQPEGLFYQPTIAPKAKWFAICLEGTPVRGLRSSNATMQFDPVLPNRPEYAFYFSRAGYVFTFTSNGGRREVMGLNQPGWLVVYDNPDSPSRAKVRFEPELPASVYFD